MVFEDRDARYEDLLRGWTSIRARGKPAMVRYDLPEDRKGSVIDDVIRRLQSDNVGMVIVDEDLSRYPGEGYIVSSDVKNNCRRLGIPICAYSKGSDEYRINESQSWTKAQVTLNSRGSVRVLAAKCKKVYSGFHEIRSAFEKGHRGEKKFGEVLPILLDAPELAIPQINQYAWGHFEVLSELRGQLQDTERALAVASTVAGYWVFNVLLRFPGVLLNEIAAASYLGVSPSAFSRSSKAQKVFAQARYRGPFSDLHKVWWRTRLDEIIAKNTPEGTNTIDGRRLLADKGIQMAPCRCVEGNHVGGGYYCILTDRAVCVEHSVAPKRWLPLGADKSRIRMSVYETMAPLLGL